MNKTSLKSIDSYLQSLIQESIATVKRKHRLLREEDDPTAAQPPVDDEKEKMKKGDITTDDVIEKLNAIRAGKSFKDQQIASSLEKYISDMEDSEKTALFAFLKGISQIVTGEFDAESAVEPADSPASVEMKKTMGPKKVSIKPTVVKKMSSDKKSPTAEDTSGPVPISPKKK